jgi:molecular chaperone DnaK (HSP70)
VGSAIPALAQTNPVTDTVTGTVTVPASLTMTLSGNSFMLDPNPGTIIDTGTDAFAITANIATNDPSGYVLSETLGSAFLDGATNSIIPRSNIAPYVYSAPGTGAYGSTNLGQNNVTIAQSSAVSGASGDQWGLAWQFNIPANQAAGSYVGTIQVTAIGS